MSIRSGISSMSLGRCYAGHDISHKLTMAAKHGIESIEIFYEDLADIARPPTQSNLIAAAHYIRSLCSSLDLSISCLQPFMHYEGLLDRTHHAKRIEEMKLWIKLAQALDTDMILIPSSFLPATEISPSIDLIVADMREVADLGLQQNPPIRFSYESLSWGTYIDKWEQSWDIVNRVDRPNFGLCLDTFNILGRIYADPTAASGCNPDAQQVVDESMRKLVQTLKPNVHKIFFLQLADAELLATPMSPSHPFHRAGQPPRMSWSRNCRLFYGEQERGAYLPVRQVADAIVNEIGYRGYISAELFNRDMERRDYGVVEEMAARAAVSWERFVRDLGLEGEVEMKGNMGRQTNGVGMAALDGAEVARL